MEQITSTESQLAESFKDLGAQYASEREVLSKIYNDLSHKNNTISNKDIILALLQLLEEEKDVIKLDIYRQALEIVVQQTPDDASY
ncbi:biofilm development regulator YmgB/AriR family protein [Pantoea sp. At-9b]|uniref:biofilm development regulator YmgB/AriR family protein n=1 Tax=Pantoea sp. (strain At-9b) TaxID=592316 RepID=UPI0001B3F4E8|nr:biofilm development regulator YmgB/AriR family protein [Pantoea sp. At-9b]ADU69444.1 hypothetical protein Pat9b_2132 [Pantoea sp. At-9b]